MRHLTLSCLLAACLFTACEQKVPVTKDTAEIEFETTDHDFGNFKAGSTQEFDFVFHNVGNTPLYIREANPTCGCIKVKFSEDPVQPGHSGKITASYSKTNNSPGYFHKAIAVHSSAQTKFVRLHVRGQVTKAKD